VLVVSPLDQQSSAAVVGNYGRHADRMKGGLHVLSPYRAGSLAGTPTYGRVEERS
jgi:hypothetical protein